MNKSLQTASLHLATASALTSNLNLPSKMTPDAKFEVLPTPIKSENDKKQYKVIRLKNGLKVCLISYIPTNAASISTDSDHDETDEESDFEESDEGSDDSVVSAEDKEEEERDCKMKKVPSVEQRMAAAALCVGVGSFSDPKKIPGMAHFLEHMVFMGSEKFPQENDFDSFIKKRGGSDNASTDYETTTFYFECLEKHLYRGLDKFAQFFISPLMKRTSMTREREAIDSEFQMALPSDTYRKEQLLLSLSNPASPVNSFSWGNLVTLRDNVSDDKLYNSLHEFRKRHYSGHRMTLAIEAKLPLDTLESYAIECFSAIPNNELPPEDFKKFADGIFDTTQFKKIYYVKPNKDICQIELTWALPSLLHKYKTKPHQYVSWLLGDEGKGSLLSYLRKKVWALSIYTGNSESGAEHNSLYALFTVTLVLTEDGLNHLSEVIEAVFSYINLLVKLGPQERIFNEMKSIEDTSFRFANEETAVDRVEELSEAMQYYPPEDYLRGSELFFEYDPEAIKMVMNELKANKMNIMVLSSHVPDNIKHTKIEPWFGTPYIDQDIPLDWLSTWMNATPLAEFALPKPNPFLTQDFALLPFEQNHEYPQKVIDTSVLRLWYKADHKFQLPQAYYYFYLISPLTLESATHACMLDLFVVLLGLHLIEEGYPAQVAELSYSVSVLDKGILIKIYGYNEKLPILVELIATYMKRFPKDITTEVFQAVKYKQSKNYCNRLLKPSTLAKDMRLAILLDNYSSLFKKHSAISEVTFEMVREFSKDFINDMYIEALIQGNVDVSVATAASQKLINVLKCRPLIPSKFPKIRTAQLALGEYCCRIKSCNNGDTNSIITNYYQSGPFTIKSSIIVELILQLIEEPLFDTLRTKEQLGYHVDCTLRDTMGVLGYSITVNTQAIKHTTNYVDERIEIFVKGVQKTFKKMSEKKFIQLKRDLIKIKNCSDIDLQDEVSRNWAEIANEDYIFDRIIQEITAIEETKISDIRKFWDEHNVFGKKENFRKLSVQVVGHNTAATTKTKNKKGKESKKMSVDDSEDKNECVLILLGNSIDCAKEKKVDGYFIEDVEDFKQSLNFYPSPLLENK